VKSGERETMSEQLKPKHYKDLLVWQKGMVLAKAVYRLSMRFPREEKSRSSSLSSRSEYR
jgi:hypothetical protein